MSDEKQPEQTLKSDEVLPGVTAEEYIMEHGRPEKAAVAIIPLDSAPFTFNTLEAVANTDFVPKGLRGKPKAILAAILTGRELGLGPMESLRSIDVIDGRPSPSAEWMVSRIFEAGHILEIEEQTDERCTVKGTRFMADREITMSFTFTIKMAERANLTGKFNWKAYPEAMLYWRAVAQLARQLYPDVLRGIKHLPDELGADNIDVYGQLPEETTEIIETTEGSFVDPETGEMIEEVETTVVEKPVLLTDPEAPATAAIWTPTPTGKADAIAIEEVREVDVEALRELLAHLVGTYEEWIEGTIPVIHGHLRYLFRGMERIGAWQGENVLRDELHRHGDFNHLGELPIKAELQKFSRNMVLKAQLALREETTNA